MSCQPRSLAPVFAVSIIQVAPELVETQMSPPNAAAAKSVPFEDDVMELHT